MTVFVGELIEVLLAYFRCRTHMSEGAYEPIPDNVLQSTIEDRPGPGMVRPLAGSYSVGPQPYTGPAG